MRTASASRCGGPAGCSPPGSADRGCRARPRRRRGPTSASARFAPSSAARVRIASNSASGMRTKPSDRGGVIRILLRRSADLAAPEGRVVGGEVAVRDPEIPLQLDGIAAVSGTMVCSQIAVASETWVAEISPREPRISVVPFSTEPPAHPRRGAGVDLVEQRRAEEVGAVRRAPRSGCSRRRTRPDRCSRCC